MYFKMNSFVYWMIIACMGVIWANQVHSITSSTIEVRPSLKSLNTSNREKSKDEMNHIKLFSLFRRSRHITPSINEHAGINHVTNNDGIVQPSKTSLPHPTNNRMSVRAARILLLLCCLSYASNYSTTKYLQGFISPIMVTFLRFVIGSIYFLPSLIRSIANASLPRELVARSIELGTWSGIGFIAQALILDNTSAGKVSLFSSLSVVIPPILDLIFPKNKLASSSTYSVNRDSNYNSNRHHVKRDVFLELVSSAFVAPMIAVTGAMVMEWGGFSDPQLSDIYLIITPIAFALAFWRSEALATEYQDDLMSITGVLLSTVVVISGAWAMIAGDMPSSISSAWQLTKLIALDSKLLIGMLATGLLATAWTSLMEQKALRIVSAAEMTMIYSLEPLFALMFAWGFIDEPVTLNLIIGAAFVLVACGWDTKRVDVAASLRNQASHHHQSANTQSR